MNWSQMTPRERDALVAEKVMGWIPPAGNSGSFLFRRLQRIPFYTTDPRDCAMVKAKCEYYTLSKVSTDGFAATVHIDGKTGFSEGRDQFQPQFQPTEELAVCLAALRAKGVEIEG